MMNDEYTPSQAKPSMLPLLLGAIGLGFGIIGTVVGISAYSSLSDMEKKITVIASVGTDTKKFKEDLSRTKDGIASVGNANNALAVQVEDLGKAFNNLRNQTQNALEEVTGEINKNRTLINQGTRSSSRPTNTSSNTTSTSSNPTPIDGTYIVQPGDTLSAIGTKVGVSWQKIAEANPDVDPNRLRVGQALQLP